jgi:hypothetical protein
MNTIPDMSVVAALTSEAPRPVDWSRMHAVLAAAEAQRLLVEAISLLTEAAEAQDAGGRPPLDLIAGSIVTNVALLHQLRHLITTTGPLPAAPRRRIVHSAAFTLRA